MAEVVKMPRMSDTMTEGTIVSWNKKVGDKIKTGDVLAEIETDKAVMDFESYLDGILLYIGAEKGTAVAVDQVIAVIGKEGEDYKAVLASAPTPAAKPAEAKKEATPQQAAAPAATPKPVEAKNSSQTATATAAPQPAQVATSGDDSKIKASPLAKKIAAENGIDLKKISGTGGDGRIIKRDVEKIKPGTQQKPAAPPLPSVSLSGEEGSNDVAVSQIRKTIARRLTESMFSAPHFYLTIEVNMDNAVSARTQINEISPTHISYNDMVIKASALALLRHPKVNASWMGDTLRYYQHVHIGVAVAIDEGLLVPVIRFADKKSFSEINTEVKVLSKKAKERKLQPPEMEGSTFTVSNLGMMDIDEFTAIINPPNSCILAVGTIKQVPAVINNEIKIANVMKLTMSCDHRVVDGATGAQFLQTLKRFLENPVMMLVS
jgi:pyruvate dehydrogenase E2 component (dihydrolipoamide acetyltransferase)